MKTHVFFLVTLLLVVASAPAFARTSETERATPTVTTQAASGVMKYEATLHGNVSSDGGSAVTARGFVWSIDDATPEIGEANVFVVAAGDGVGAFSATARGLRGGVLHHVRAFATNAEGTTYGIPVDVQTQAAFAYTLRARAQGVSLPFSGVVEGNDMWVAGLSPARVYKTNVFDRSSPQDIFSTASQIWDIALYGNEIFGVDNVNDRVFRFNKANGSGVDLRSLQVPNMTSIAVDETTVYLGDLNQNRVVRMDRATFQGETNFVADQPDVTGLALDDTYVYWGAGSSVRRAPKANPGQVQTLWTGFTMTWGIEVIGQTLYIMDLDAGVLYAADKDGQGVKTTISTALGGGNYRLPFAGSNGDLFVGAATGSDMWLFSDTQPSMYFESDGFRRNEDTGTVSAIVSLNNHYPTGGPQSTANLSTSGSAEQGGDYTLANQPIIAAGERSVSINIAVINDEDMEADETVRLELGQVTHPIIPTRNTFTLTIADNDPGLGPLDFGDAPDPYVFATNNYPTLAASNGARHVATGPILGEERTAEADGQPHAMAQADEGDDGVSLPGQLQGGAQAEFQFWATGAGKLDAWIDFNRDGDWNDAGERIFNAEPLVNELNTRTITIPATVVPGLTFVRFRYSEAGGLPPDGLAMNGEVEDYTVTLTSKLQFAAGTTGTLQVQDNAGAVTLSDLLQAISYDAGRTVTWSIQQPPNHGGSLGGFPATAVSGSGPTSPTGLTYTPAVGYQGPESFIVSLSDGVTTTAMTVTVTVSLSNRPPVAVADRVTTAEDTAILIDVLANDSDPDGDALVVSIWAQPSSGSAVVQPNGSVLYTPNTNVADVTDQFDYVITDVHNALTSQRVYVTIQPVNDPPVAATDAVSTNQSQPVVIDVLANDTDVESTVVLQNVGQPQHGTTSVGPDGKVTYMPTLGYHGSDSFTYTISDGTVSVSGQVSITVVDINVGPVAQDDAAATIAGVPVRIPVLENDSDEDGDVLQVNVSASVPQGSAVVDETGGIVYTPAASADGLAAFMYTVSDPAGASATATVRIQITGPSSDGDNVADDVENGAANGGDGNGDGIPDGNQKNVASLPIAEGPHSGSYVTLATDLGIELQQVRSTVNPSPADFPAGSSAPVGFLDFRINGIEVGGSASVTLHLPEGVQAGNYLKYGPTADNPTPHWYSFTYDPATRTGAQVFQRSIVLHFVDGGRGDADMTANGVIVDPGAPASGLNSIPVAVDDEVVTQEDTSVGIAVLDNDSDADGTMLTVSLHSTPSHGSVTVNANGTFQYQPMPDYFGQDSFVYRISDPDGGTADATVRVTVTPVEDIPIAVADSAATDEDTAVNIAFLANDRDADGQTFYLVGMGQPAHGTATYNADRTVTYVPEANFSGVDSWSYAISDGPGGSGQIVSAMITVVVTGLQDAPIGVADTGETFEDIPVLLDVLANDHDPDGDAVLIIGLEQPASGGTVSILDGSVWFVPTPNFNGELTFTYTLGDGNDTSSPVIVRVHVTAVNDAPMFAEGVPIVDLPSDSPVALETESMAIGLSYEAATDVEGDAVVYTWEISASESFDVILFALQSDESGHIELLPDDLIAALQLEIGADVTVFHRMSVTDANGATTKSEHQRVTFTRPSSVHSETQGELPTEVYLSGNYPNPFNPSTTIVFGLPKAGSVRLQVYDIEGRLARTLIQEVMEPGHHRIQVSMDGLASGIYLYRLETSGKALSRTMQFIK